MSKDSDNKVSVLERLGYQVSDMPRLLKLQSPENKELAIQEQRKMWDATVGSNKPVTAPEVNGLCQELFKDNYVAPQTFYGLRQDPLRQQTQTTGLKPPPLSTPTQEQLNEASNRINEQKKQRIDLPRLGIDTSDTAIGHVPNGNELSEEEKKKKKQLDNGITLTLDTPLPLNEKDLEGKEYSFKFDGKEHSSSVKKDPGNNNQYRVDIDPPLEPGKEAEGMKAFFTKMGMKEPLPELTTLKNGEKGYDLSREHSDIFMKAMGITPPEKEQDKNKDQNKGPNFPSHNQGGNKGLGFSSVGNWGKVEETNGVQKQSLPNVNQPGKDGHQK